MPERVALVTVDDIAKAYDFGASHPLRPERVLLTYDNVRDVGLLDLDHVEEIAYRVATDAEVAAVHDSRFIDVVRGIDSGDVEARAGLGYGLGTGDNPIFVGMHKASLAVCGASVTAAEAVARGDFDHAFNPAGGLHHARRAEASGFCIYNDPAVAIAKVLELQPEWRVVYLDVDVHHGDGVQWIFYDEPRVLTVSLHQSGRYLYPGTGFEDELGDGSARGTSLNVPLLPLTGNDDYLWALEEVLTKATAAFRPDLIVTQLGADTHHGDPLANLGLTMTAYPKMARLIHQVADELCGGRWVATGGGGYQAETVVPKVWTIHFAEMCGRADLIPDEWLKDVPGHEVARSYGDQVRESVDGVLSEALPLLGQAAGA